MPNVVEIEVNRGQLQAVLNRTSTDRFTRVITKSVGEALGFLQTQVRAFTPVDLGIARAQTGIDGPRLERGDIIGAVVNPLFYDVVLEYGRRPGATPPPVSSLVPWVTRHGMPLEAAFPIARSIGRRGIRAHRMFRRAAEEGVNVIGGIIASGLADL